jgi:hypothetical protein
MVQSGRARRRVLVFPFLISAMVLFGTGSVQAAMLAGDGLDSLALEPDRNLDDVDRAAYLTVAPATAIAAATTDDDSPFLCRMDPADTADD